MIKKITSKGAIMYPSRRGAYIAISQGKKNIFKSMSEIGEYINSFNLPKFFFDNVKKEYDLFKKSDLSALNSHSFWTKEDKALLCEYNNLYFDLREAFKKGVNGSKNVIAVNKNTCLTAIQIHGKRLIAFQRSCDITLGYLADLYTLLLFMDEFGLSVLEWYIGVPHYYLNNKKATYSLFNEKIRLASNFNVRGTKCDKLGHTAKYVIN